MRARTAVLPVAAVATAVALTAGSAPASQTHAAASPCEVNQVRIFYLGNEGAAGTFFEKFRYNKRGKGSCTMTGFPEVTLTGKAGKDLPVVIHNDHSQKVHTRVLRKGHPVYFQISHPDPSLRPKSTCQARAAYRFKVFVPGQAKTLTLKGFDPVRFCQKRAKVTPFSNKQQ